MQKIKSILSKWGFFVQNCTILEGISVAKECFAALEG